jgi:hypothetical protein
MQKHAVIGAILVLLVSAIAIIYFLAKANFHATGVFWYGATAGFGGCLFLSTLILTILIVATKRTLTKKHSLWFFMLILSALVTATLWFFKPGDSDVWWYGAIAGFFSCLIFVFLVLIIYLDFKLRLVRY